MKRFFLTFALIILFVLMLSTSLGQNTDPIPTLIPPTLVPTVPSAITDALLSESAVASIQSTGVFRVGILYNQAPFGELSINGELHGFDAELAQVIADTWEVEIEYKQVTRQNALDVLNSGQVDAVFSAFVHYREYDAKVDFSQTYLISKQAMMVLADSELSAPTALINQPVGYVMATRAETAYRAWGESRGLPLNLQAFPTLDRAFVALAQGEIKGLVGSEEDLLRVSANHPDLVKILDDSIAVEAHAVAVRRQDVNMRNLLNRTFQFLADSGDFAPLYASYFPTKEVPEDALYLYVNIGEDAPKPSDFATDVPYPPQYTMPRVLDSGILRVAGISNLDENSSESLIRLDAINREIVQAVANRWGVSVEIIPSTVDQGISMLQNGEADILVGIQADWRLADQVDFAAPYLLQGDRMMIPANSQIASFNDLRGQWIATLIGDEGADARAKAWADSINAHINFYQTTEEDALDTILVEHNADVIYGNSLKLISQLEANPDKVKLTDRWYSRAYYSFAVPRNDIDFRLLVEYSIQEMIKDGTLERLTRPLTLSETLPVFDIWSGSAQYLGINLAA